MYLLVFLAESAHSVAQEFPELGGVDGGERRGLWHRRFQVVHEGEKLRREGAVPLLSVPDVSRLSRKSLFDAMNTGKGKQGRQRTAGPDGIHVYKKFVRYIHFEFGNCSMLFR